MKALGIGELINYKGKTYKVKECKLIYSCVGCAFSNGKFPGRCATDNGFADAFGECAGLARSDGKYVIFAEERR